MQDTPSKLKTFQTYIDGKWCNSASGKTFQTYDPYSGEAWAEVPECDATDVDRACNAAAKAFETGPWPAMTQTGRGRLLRKIAGLIEQHGDYLAQVEVRDNGKLISEWAKSLARRVDNDSGIDTRTKAERALRLGHRLEGACPPD